MKNKYNIKICNVFKQAEILKEELHHEYVGTEHILLSILKEDEPITAYLNSLGLNFDNFYTEIKDSMSPVNNYKLNQYTPLLKKIILCCEKEDDLSINNLVYHILDVGEGVALRILFNMNIDVDAIYQYLKNSPNDNLEIYKYGKRLSKYVNPNECVIGRDKEINLIIETLLRKKKNNPLLIGEAGVGKSAIIEELTRRIINGNVPEKLLNTEIVSLEMGNLLSGTRYRGEFEERINLLINELIDNPNIIIFIDEIHTLANAGASEGAISASDILKPYLARGDIKCIGATTTKEYENSILKDKALTRRFENIYIKEPDEEETYNILNKVKTEYINYHHINISDETIRVLVTLAGTYFPNKKNPDKSIELLDSVMSYVKLKQSREIIENKELELKRIKMNKYEEVEKGNFKEALKNNVIEKKLERELNSLKNDIKTSITKEDIIDVLEFKNNIIFNKDKIIKAYFKEKVPSNILNSLSSKLKNQNQNITIMMLHSSKDFISSLAKAINYEVFYLNENNIESLFKKIRYNPSLLIVSTNSDNYKVENILKKIKKDSLVEHNEEYYAFNNTITLIINKKELIGFKSNYICEIPIDFMLDLKEQIS